MSVWQQLMAGRAWRCALGVYGGAGGPRRVGVDGETLVADPPADFGSDVSVGAVPDAGTLLRRLSLPPAKAAVTDRLVRQQVASLLPGMDARLAIAWRRDGQSGDVTVAAGPRAALRSASDELGLRGCDLLVPCGLALDALLSRGMSESDTPTAWAVDCGKLTWLLLYAGGGLIAADSVGPNEAVEAVFADLAAGLESGQQPTQLTWVGRDGSLPAVAPGVTCTAALDLPDHTGWSGGIADAAGWLAAGAALIGRQARDAEGLDLDDVPAAAGDTGTSAPRRRPGRVADGPRVSGRRWAGVGLWLLGALGLWAWAVASGGARQTAVVEELGLSRSLISELDRGLAVGRYLETSGPSLLAVLDELGQKTEGWMLDEAGWERDAGLTLRGNQRSAEALAQLAQSMATMRTLSGVQVRRQAPVGDDAVSYTIMASPSAKYYGAFVEPPKPAGDEVVADAPDGAGSSPPREGGVPESEPSAMRDVGVTTGAVAMQMRRSPGGVQGGAGLEKVDVEGGRAEIMRKGAVVMNLRNPAGGNE